MGRQGRSAAAGLLGPGPAQQHRQWIIDIDGTRLVIAEWSFPGSTAEKLSEMDEFLASIQIGEPPPPLAGEKGTRLAVMGVAPSRTDMEPASSGPPPEDRHPQSAGLGHAISVDIPVIDEASVCSARTAGGETTRGADNASLDDPLVAHISGEVLGAVPTGMRPITPSDRTWQACHRSACLRLLVDRAATRQRRKM